MPRDRQWVMVSTRLLRHRKLVALAGELGVDRVTAQGLLVGVWQIARADPKHWRDLMPEDVAHALHWTGDGAALLDALEATGFLERNEAGALTIHDWHEYSGEQEEDERREPGRAKNRERQQRHRDKERAERDSNVTSPPSDSLLERERESESLGDSNVTSRDNNANQPENTDVNDLTQDAAQVRADPTKCYKCKDVPPTVQREMYGMGRVNMCDDCAAWFDQAMKDGRVASAGARRGCPDCRIGEPCDLHRLPPDLSRPDPTTEPHHVADAAE